MIGRLAFLAAERLRGSRSLELLGQIRDEPSLSREVVLQRQLTRVQELLAHVERNVPYYQEMFARLGITSRDVRSFSDFASLPILTKDIVRERRDDLISKTYGVARLQPHYSGGSTGQPLSFYHEAEYIAASNAGTYRSLEQVGWRAGDMIAFFWGWSKRLYSMPRLEFEARQWLRRQYQFDSFRAGDEEFARWVRTWRRIRPVVGYGYASAIARFAAYLNATGENLPPLRGVFTTAEKLLPQQRTDMERAFCCDVFDCYGSSEVRNIATQCSAGSMHVNADYVVLETQERGGAGGAQPFIVTSLRARAMPFIRYRNEDCGGLLEGECSCGSGFPLMRLDIARTSDHFLLPGGKLVHGLFFIHRLYGSSGVANFQFHQCAPDRIVLYAVRDVSTPGFDESVARAAEEVRQASSAPITVEIREVESIPLSTAGKHRYVRSDVSGDL